MANWMVVMICLILAAPEIQSEDVQTTTTVQEPCPCLAANLCPRVNGTSPDVSVLWKC